MIDPTIFLQSGGLQEQTMKERNVQIGTFYMNITKLYQPKIES